MRLIPDSPVHLIYETDVVKKKVATSGGIFATTKNTMKIVLNNPDGGQKSRFTERGSGRRDGKAGNEYLTGRGVPELGWEGTGERLFDKIVTNSIPFLAIRGKHNLP